MNNSRTKRLPQIIIGQFLVSALIFVIASYLVLYSLGYKINLTTRKIIKTGLIVLSIDPKPQEILLDGKDIEPKSDTSISLEPGFYNVTVKKDGYQDWSTRSEVKGELVNYYKYVELFKSEVKLVELQDQGLIDILNSPSNTLAVNTPKGLTNNDYEIWIQSKLVTRFSSPISQAIWYSDNHHILFQQGGSIHIIDEDGSNNKTLVNLSDSSICKFVISNKGQDLLILQSSKYYIATIQ